MDESHRAAVIVGRLSPFKGQSTFIRTIADSRLAERNVHGYIVGYPSGEGRYDDPPRPDYEEYLRQLVIDCGVEDRVHFLGKQPGHVAFSAADVACVLSDCEDFGLVTIEATAMGAPLVATNAGGIPELFTHESTSLLVPPRDPDAAAGAIARLFDDEAFARSLVSRAEAEVLPRVTQERFIADVQRQVRGLLDLANAPS